MELWIHRGATIASSMSAWLGPISAALQTASAVLVAGVPFFRWLNSACAPELSARMSRQAVTILLIALPVFVVAQLGQLTFQLAVVGDSPNALFPRSSVDWHLYLSETRPGHVWLIRTTLSLTILVVISVWFMRTRCAPVGKYSHWLFVTVAGVLLVASAALSGHYAGQSDSREYIVLHAAHLVAIALWAGSLPLWWMTIRSTKAAGSLGEPTNKLLRRYSRAAMILVVIALGTGIPLALIYIDSQGDLLGTRWGLLLVMKTTVVSLVLIAAYTVRRRLNTETLSRRWALYAVGTEIGLLLIVVVLASLLAQAVPAAHDQPFWRLPFRFSYDAISPDKSLVSILLSAIAMSAAAIALAALAYRRATSSMVTAGWMCAALISAALAVWAATIPAYPDTFRRSDVPYLAESIASGMNIYGENCVPCHGNGGRADGPLAPFTRRPPVDLAAPHTALHTAGDLFGWIGNGMPSGAMPGFSVNLSEQDRWDLVNFLRTFSQGFQARVLNTRVVPEQSWLGAPDFYLTREDGQSSQLKALRGNTVLILIQDKCTVEMKDRIEALTRWSTNLSAPLEIVAICITPEQEINNKRAWRAQSPAQVLNAYALLSRTLTNKGENGVLGITWPRSEFLVDRYGYIRARWIPEEDPVGWASTTTIETEINVLSHEIRIPPQPDSHLH